MNLTFLSRGRQAALAVGVLTAGAVLTAAPALAAPGLWASKTTNLVATGQSVTVSGNGYDVTKGIYVALCVDKGAGQVPSPCVGGIQTSGDSASSEWISNNPPSYAAGLVTPYGPGGSFSVTLTVKATDPVAKVDCFLTPCALVTRADHTRPQDRTQDVRIPVAFAAPVVPAAPPAAAATTSPKKAAATTPPGQAAASATTTQAATQAATEPSTADTTGPLTSSASPGPASAPGEVALTNTASSSDDGGGVPASAVVGIVLGVVLLAGGGLWLRRRGPRAGGTA